MARIAKIVIGFFIFGIVFVGQVSAKSSAVTAEKTVASRKWVSKLKQTSFSNRKSFQFATPVVDEQKVYVGVQSGLFYAVHAKKGKKVWKYQAQGAIHAQAVVDESKVYFGDIKGMVYALDKKDGQLVWASKVGGEVMSAPLLHENRLFVVTLSKELSAIDKNNGQILWQKKHSASDSGFAVRGSSDPVLAGGNLLVGYADGVLIAYDPKTGTQQWTKQLGNRIDPFHDVDATVLVGKDIAYIASADEKLFAINPANGTTLWEAPIGGANTLAFEDPYLYATAQGVVHCLKADSGEIVWEQNLDIPELSSPVLYGPWLASASTKGPLYFLNRMNGDVYQSWHVKGGSLSQPILQGKRLYLLSNTGRLYSFEFGDNKP